jgi:hypothetical protein
MTRDPTNPFAPTEQFASEHDFANKWICLKCRFIGPIEAFYFVPDPRRGAVTDGWYACNWCDSVDQITTACDEYGCTREGSCGFPVDDVRRYRRTCFEHSKFNRKAVEKTPE